MSVPIYLWANILYKTWAAGWNLKSINESVLQWPQPHYSLCYVLTCPKHITILVFFLAASTQPLKKWKQQQKQSDEETVKHWMPLLSAGKTMGPSGPDITDGIRPRVSLPLRSMRQLQSWQQWTAESSNIPMSCNLKKTMWHYVVPHGQSFQQFNERNGRSW